MNELETSLLAQQSNETRHNITHSPVDTNAINSPVSENKTKQMRQTNLSKLEYDETAIQTDSDDEQL